MIRERRVSPAQVVGAVALVGALGWWVRTSARALEAYLNTSDFTVVVEAGRRLWSGAAVYLPFDLRLGNVFQTGSSSISYPPSSFVVLAPWIALPDPWRSVSWVAVQWIALAVVIGGVYLAIGRPRAAEGMLAIAACLVLYPVRDCLGEGQFGILLTAVAVVALLAHERGMPAVGGVALGIGIALKLNPVLLLPFFLYLRAYRVLGWTALTAALVVGVTLVAGWGPRWLEYFQLVGPLGRGTALSANQSLNGVLLRLWRPDLVGQPITDLPAWFRAAWYAGDLLIAGGTAFLVRRVGVGTALQRWACLGIVLTAVALVEPFAWVHHLVGLTILAIVGARLVASGVVARSLAAAMVALLFFLSFAARYTILLPSETSLRLPLPALTTSLTFLAALAALAMVGLAVPADRLRSK